MGGSLLHKCILTAGLLLLNNIGVLRACAQSENPKDFVTWGAAGECNPPVCGGSKLLDIMDAPGKLPVSVAANMTLFDTAQARAALAGRHIVLLGDSTMGETHLDLGLLLSGVQACTHIPC